MTQNRPHLQHDKPPPKSRRFSQTNSSEFRHEIESEIVTRIPRNCCARSTPFERAAGQSDPRLGATPGAANALQEGGRSGPLCGLPATRERQKNAARIAPHLVEPPNTG